MCVWLPQQRVVVNSGMGLADAVAAAHHPHSHLSHHPLRSDHSAGDAASAMRR
jgi:hypothetical protein